MPDEIFDVVNEHDQVIGQQTRKEVHRQSLRHRAIHVLVFNERGQIFLQKRSMQKDTAAGKWDSSSSGHLDTGEQYDQCAIRELREEIESGDWFTPEAVTRWMNEKPDDFASAFALIWQMYIASGNAE